MWLLRSKIRYNRKVKKIRRIHLDKVEASLLVGVVFLISGMMFTLGVLVGYGIGEKKNLTGTKVALTEHGKSVVETVDHSPHRAPASAAEEASPKKAPGERIRSDFRKAKQEALNQFENEAPSLAKPVSVADTEAYFSDTQNERSPASLEQIPRSRKATVFPKADNEVAVNQLFERRPSSKEVFKPVFNSYTVQIASYSTADEANGKVVVLREAGFSDAFVIPIKSGGEQWFRVAVGSFKDKEWAKKSGEKLVKKKLANDFIVRQVN